MLDDLTRQLTAIIETNPWLAPLAAFAGGLMTAANPCVLAMVPLMVGYVAGQESPSLRRSFVLSIVFSIGLTITFAVMFLATWAASSILNADWWTCIAAGICLLMGLQLMGVLQLRFPAIPGARPAHKGMIGALMLGLLFGLISLPCAGPVLLALLAVIPLRGFTFGAVVLVAYGLGHCGLILIGGTSMGIVQSLANSRGWSRSVLMIQRVAGAIIMLIGVTLLLS